MACFLPSASFLGRFCRNSFLSCLFLALALLPLAGWGQSIKFDNLWNGDVYCQASSLYVSFKTTGTFNNNNVFIVEVSDANGSFSAPTQIISGNPTPYKLGFRSFTCPLASCSTGSGRYIRVRSTSPAVTSQSSPSLGSVISSFGIVSNGQITADFPSGDLPIATVFDIPYYTSCANANPNLAIFWLSDSTGSFDTDPINITYDPNVEFRQVPIKKRFDSVANELIPELNQRVALIPDPLKACSRYRIKVSYGDDANYLPAISDYYYTPIGAPTLTAATTGYAGATFSGTLSLPCFLPANAGHINISLSDVSGTAGFVQRAIIPTLNGGSFSFTVPTNTLTGNTYKIQATTDVPGLWTWTSGNITINNIATTLTNATSPAYAGATYSGTLNLSSPLPTGSGPIQIWLSDASGNSGFTPVTTIASLSGGTFSFPIPANTVTGYNYKLKATSDVSWNWTSGSFEITNFAPTVLSAPVNIFQNMLYTSNILVSPSLPAQANKIYIQLSDSSGTFSNQYVDTLNNLAGGMVSFALPTNTPKGLHYRIKATTDLSFWSWTSAYFGVVANPIIPTGVIPEPYHVCDPNLLTIPYVPGIKCSDNQELRITYSLKEPGFSVEANLYQAFNTSCIGDNLAPDRTDPLTSTDQNHGWPGSVIQYYIYEQRPITITVNMYVKIGLAPGTQETLVRQFIFYYSPSMTNSTLPDPVVFTSPLNAAGPASVTINPRNKLNGQDYYTMKNYIITLTESQSNVLYSPSVNPTNRTDIGNTSRILFTVPNVVDDSREFEISYAGWPNSGCLSPTNSTVVPKKICGTALPTSAPTDFSLSGCNVSGSTLTVGALSLGWFVNVYTGGTISSDHKSLAGGTKLNILAPITNSGPYAVPYPDYIAAANNPLVVEINNYCESYFFLLYPNIPYPTITATGKCEQDPHRTITIAGLGAAGVFTILRHDGPPSLATGTGDQTITDLPVEDNSPFLIVQYHNSCVSGSKTVYPTYIPPTLAVPTVTATGLCLSYLFWNIAVTGIRSGEHFVIKIYGPSPLNSLLATSVIYTSDQTFDNYPVPPGADHLVVEYADACSSGQVLVVPTFNPPAMTNPTFHFNDVCENATSITLFTTGETPLPGVTYTLTDKDGNLIGSGYITDLPKTFNVSPTLEPFTITYGTACETKTQILNPIVPKPFVCADFCVSAQPPLPAPAFSGSYTWTGFFVSAASNIYYQNVISLTSTQPITYSYNFNAIPVNDRIGTFHLTLTYLTCSYDYLVNTHACQIQFRPTCDDDLHIQAILTDFGPTNPAITYYDNTGIEHLYTGPILASTLDNHTYVYFNATICEKLIKSYFWYERDDNFNNPKQLSEIDQTGNAYFSDTYFFDGQFGVNQDAITIPNAHIYIWDKFALFGSKFGGRGAFLTLDNCQIEVHGRYDVAQPVLHGVIFLAGVDNDNKPSAPTLTIQNHSKLSSGPCPYMWRGILNSDDNLTGIGQGLLIINNSDIQDAYDGVGLEYGNPNALDGELSIQITNSRFLNNYVSVRGNTLDISGTSFSFSNTLKIFSNYQSLPVALLKPCQSLKLSEWEASFIIKELYTG